MNQLTLEQALELVHPWVGTWTAPTWCQLTMPRATDELAMRVLRKLPSPHMLISLHWGFAEGEWTAEIGVWGLAEPYAKSTADNPRDAIIIAAGMWLQSQSAGTPPK